MMRPSRMGTPGHALGLLAVMTGAWLVVGMSGRPHGRQAVPRPWFEDVTTAVGLDFTHRNGARGEFRIQEIIGAGVGLIDYDNDGDLDVITVQGGETEARRRTERRQGSRSRWPACSGTTFVWRPTGRGCCGSWT